MQCYYLQEAKLSCLQEFLTQKSNTHFLQFIVFFITFNYKHKKTTSQKDLKVKKKFIIPFLFFFAGIFFRPSCNHTVGKVPKVTSGNRLDPEQENHYDFSWDAQLCFPQSRKHPFSGGCGGLRDGERGEGEQEARRLMALYDPFILAPGHWHTCACMCTSTCMHMGSPRDEDL